MSDGNKSSEYIKILERKERCIDIYIYDFDHPKEHLGRINTIRNATENDLVHLKLNTPGGYLSTLMQYINAMEDSDARIIAHAEGNVYSAGIILFLACNEWRVYDNSHFMFHDVSTFTGGKGNSEIGPRSDSLIGLSENINKKYLSKVLTKEEIKKMTHGTDIYLTSDEMCERLEKYVNKGKKKKK